MSIIYLTLIATLVFIFGLSLALWLKLQSWLEVWGVSWLLGMGWSTMLWFLSYYVLGQAFSLSSIFQVLLASNLISWIGLWLIQRNWLMSQWANFRFLISSLHLKKLQQSHIIWWGSLSLLIIFAFVMFQDVFWPVTDWDALALYDFRAKVILATGSLEQGKQLEYFFQYPLFTSVLHAWTYFSGLGVAKIWYGLIYQAAVILFFVLIRKKNPSVVAMTGALLFATSPLIFTHSYMAYTNLSYTVFGGLGFIYLWQWWSDQKLQHLFLGAMLVGLSTWVRISEPFYFVAVVVILAGILKYTKQHGFKVFPVLTGVVSLGLVLLTRYPWDSLITSLYGVNVNTPMASLSLVQTWSPRLFLGRSTEVIKYLWVNSAPVYLWYSILGLGLLVIDLKQRRYQVLCAWLTTIAVLGAIFVGTLLLSFSLESWNRIGDSVNRMSLFLVPLWIYVIFSSPSWENISRKLP